MEKDADEGPFSEATVGTHARMHLDEIVPCEVKLSWAPELQGNRLPEADLGRRDALSQWAWTSRVLSRPKRGAGSHGGRPRGR